MLTVLALLLSGCVGPSAEQNSDGGATTPSTIPVTLERIVDGDTIIVRLPDGARERVRYTGIDTPELAREGRPAEPLGEAAAKRNEELLTAGDLGLEMDVQERDDFGRILAYVWVGDVLVSEQLIREGLAEIWTHPPNVRHVDDFTAAQREARAAGRGMWAEPQP